MIGRKTPRGRNEAAPSLGPNEEEMPFSEPGEAKKCYFQRIHIRWRNRSKISQILASLSELLNPAEPKGLSRTSVIGLSPNPIKREKNI